MRWPARCRLLVGRPVRWKNSPPGIKAGSCKPSGSSGSVVLDFAFVRLGRRGFSIGFARTSLDRRPNLRFLYPRSRALGIERCGSKGVCCNGASVKSSCSGSSFQVRKTVRSPGRRIEDSLDRALRGCLPTLCLVSTSRAAASPVRANAAANSAGSVSYTHLRAHET